MTDWQLTIDCADPTTLVEFWSRALGYRPQPAPEGFDTWNDYYRSVGVPDDELDANGDGCDRIFDPAGAGPPIWFQIVPEKKTLKNRFHFDLYPTRRDRSLPMDERRRLVDALVDELVEQGASVIRRQPDDASETDETLPDFYNVLMADPEGNEFCVA